MTRIQPKRIAERDVRSNNSKRVHNMLKQAAMDRQEMLDFCMQEEVGTIVSILWNMLTRDEVESIAQPKGDGWATRHLMEDETYNDRLSY
jgi:hypothetical protein